MEEEKVPSKPADARVVRAVRKLKSNITQSSNTLEENKTKESKTESSKAISRDTENESDKNLKILSNKSINNIRQKIPSKNSNNKILIDGSIKPPDDKPKTFDYKTLKRYKKRQNTSFQKNLLSADNINKYKEEFVGIIKKDQNIKSMLAQLNLIKDDNYMEYIENHFFNKPHF